MLALRYRNRIACYRYHYRVCLIQISTLAADYVGGPVASARTDTLWQVPGDLR